MNHAMKLEPTKGGFPTLRTKSLRNYTMIFAVLGLWIIMEVLTKGVFLSVRNISLLARQAAITGVLSIGAVIVIISTNIDISTGSVLGLTGGIAAILQVQFSWPTPLAILAALVAGILIGAWQGFWVAYKKVPAFIVTLGGSLVFRGVLLVLTQGNTIAPLQKSFTIIGDGFVPKPIGYGVFFAAVAMFAAFTIFWRRDRILHQRGVPTPFGAAASIVGIGLVAGLFVFVLNSYQGIPYPVVITIALAIAFSLLMTHSTLGRRIYAIGGNREAARLSGIKVDRNVFYIFLIMGGLCAAGGVLMTARMNAAAPSAGTGMELDAIAAAVLGGTSLSGGYGSIAGGILGALIMATLDNGMSLFNISSYYQYIVKGLILLLAVWFDVSVNKK